MCSGQVWPDNNVMMRPPGFGLKEKIPPAGLPGCLRARHGLSFRQPGRPLGGIFSMIPQPGGRIIYQNCTSSETSKIPFRSLTRQTDAMRRVVQHVHCIELAGYSDCNTTTGAAAASSSSATRILNHAHTAAHSPRRRRTTNRTEGGREGGTPKRRPSGVSSSVVAGRAGGEGTEEGALCYNCTTSPA